MSKLDRRDFAVGGISLFLVAVCDAPSVLGGPFKSAQQRPLERMAALEEHLATIPTQSLEAAHGLFQGVETLEEVFHELDERGYFDSELAVQEWVLREIEHDEQTGATLLVGGWLYAHTEILLMLGAIFSSREQDSSG